MAAAGAMKRERTMVQGRTRKERTLRLVKRVRWVGGEKKGRWIGGTGDYMVEGGASEPSFTALPRLEGTL
jgi:hypothetical protein